MGDNPPQKKNDKPNEGPTLFLKIILYELYSLLASSKAIFEVVVAISTIFTTVYVCILSSFFSFLSHPKKVTLAGSANLNI